MKCRRTYCLLLCLSLLAATVFAEQPAKPKLIEFTTTLGRIKVQLYDDTPQHRDNFVKLVNEGFYDGVLFHRVIKNFMAQAGDPKSRDCDSTARLGSGGLDYTIPAEIVYPQHYHKRGALAAARLGDVVNPERASSACQFYLVQGKKYNEQELNEIEHRINMVLRTTQPFKFTEAQRLQYGMFGGTPHLDGQYTVFGEIVEGFDVLDKICAVETGQADRPIADVRIIKARVVRR
ncbi:MAG: peptidylprolyl isomerase [Paludibacteraceae bacterium]